MCLYRPETQMNLKGSFTVKFDDILVNKSPRNTKTTTEQIQKSDLNASVQQDVASQHFD